MAALVRGGDEVRMGLYFALSVLLVGLLLFIEPPYTAEVLLDALPPMTAGFLGACLRGRIAGAARQRPASG